VLIHKLNKSSVGRLKSANGQGRIVPLCVGMRWERYIRREVYSAFESWQEATIVICMRLSCLSRTVTPSTATVILSSLSLLKQAFEIDILVFLLQWPLCYGQPILNAYPDCYKGKGRRARRHQGQSG
jgi:hypothetical protein